MKVLLIEDDPVLGESLKEYLEQKGCEVKWIRDDRELVSEEIVATFDVVILDLILKFRSGEEILAEIRKKGIDTPVLVLTAKNRLVDKETCFNLGADDYLTKPFEPRELILRLKALTKRTKLPPLVSIGEAEIDVESMTIRYKGREFKPSKKAWELLMLLLKNRGRVVTTETILNCLWGDRAVGSDVVRAYIKELRKMLPEESIETRKGIGYRLL